MKKLKKEIFHFLASQRGRPHGEWLFKLNRSLNHALNNKINDPMKSGEYRFLEMLDHGQISVVFDVGANVGKWTLKYQKLNDTAVIQSFEPAPETFKKLKTSTIKFHNIRANCMALSDKSGKLTFHYLPDKTTFSSVFDHSYGDKKETIEVNAITGDDFCKKNSISSIDLLKIDTEGFESNVLFGFEEMFKKQKIKIVQFEYGPLTMNSRFLLADLYKFLIMYGFEVGKIYPKWIDFSPYSIEKENFVLSNFLAIHSKHRSILIK